MKTPLYKKALATSGLAVLVSVTVNGTVLAHVIVTPKTVAPAAFQTFSMSVPNERDDATSKVSLDIPASLNSVRPTQKAGWTITMDKTGSGELAAVTRITWIGSLAAGLRDDFTFSAQAPSQAGQLQWKAYQTYDDGTTVAWDQPPSDHAGDDDHATSGPYSSTMVTSAPATTTASAQPSSAKKTADRSLIIAAAAFVIAVASLVMAQRQPRQSPAARRK